MIPLMTVWDVLLDHLDQLILTIVGVVIGGLLLEYYSILKKRQKLIIETKRDGARFGFSVYVKKGMIKDIMIEVNGKEYQREIIDQKTGTFKVDNEKNLYANRQPRYVFPFRLDAIYFKDIYKEVAPNVKVWLVDKEAKQPDGILVVIREVSTNNAVYCECMQIPSGNFATMWGRSYSKKNLYNVKISITGEGLETAKKYVLQIGLAEFIIQDIPKIRAGTSRPIREYVSLEFEHKGRFYFLKDLTPKLVKFDKTKQRFITWH